MSGYDYYQNLMLWSSPVAAEGKDLRAPCAPGRISGKDHLSSSHLVTWFTFPVMLVGGVP
jgi:hypothetical protein